MSIDPAKPVRLARGILPALAALAAIPLAAAQTAVPTQLPVPRAVATYRIKADLDVKNKLVSGSQVLIWRNVTSNPTRELRFHLYLNAFKNNRSTFARENGGVLWEIPGEVPDDYWGRIDILNLERQFDGKTVPGAIRAMEHIQPEDGNPDDETVLRVQLAEAVLPDQVLTVKIDFESKLPRGIARTGWVDGYFFGAQWFPKLGVLEEDGWNCPQYHANTEYYANFGQYDVTIRVPSDYLVAGAGEFGQRDNRDGTTSYRFTEQGIHDFAWAASNRFLLRQIQFNEGGLPPVTIRLYLQPEHADLGDRYLKAARVGLRRFGEWFGPYPYSVLSIVDPPRNSDTGGMEYPTLVTGGTYFLAPPESLSPESVTMHEVGHQWWYGMVATNEFEEAWLDEGVNSWAEARALKSQYPPARRVERFFGGFPIVFESMTIPFETLNLPPVRRYGKRTPMNLTSWMTLDRDTYQVNSYAKPEVSLWTLERLLGGQRLLQALRAYFNRHIYGHPTTEDFINAVSESVGEDLDWFFEETFFSSELVDYTVETARSSRIPPIQGRPPAAAGGNPQPASREDAPSFLTEVVVRRLEGARLPVETLLKFEDGSEVRKPWDGRGRFNRIKLESASRLLYAAVDPDRKILLDVDPVNNSRRADHLAGETSPATVKWSSKWLFWIQNLMETFAFLG